MSYNYHPTLVGVPTPRYIKAVEIVNKSNQQYTGYVKFKSGTNANIAILPNITRVVEEQINDGSASFVDPIVDISVKVWTGGPIRSLDVANPNNIEIRKFVIEENGNIVRI
jgi:hypothetical protein